MSRTATDRRLASAIHFGIALVVVAMCGCRAGPEVVAERLSRRLLPSGVAAPVLMSSRDEGGLRWQWRFDVPQSQREYETWVVAHMEPTFTLTAQEIGVLRFVRTDSGDRYTLLVTLQPAARGTSITATLTASPW